MSTDPLLQAARLWERTLAKGTRYMSGRLGGVKVVILPNRDHAQDDPANSHTHISYFQDGSATPPKAGGAGAGRTTRANPKGRSPGQPPAN